MRFVFLWLCVILFSAVVYGESDRDSLKVRLGAPRLNTGAPVLLTDSIPGALDVYKRQRQRDAGYTDHDDDFVEPENFSYPVTQTLVQDKCR